MVFRRPLLLSCLIAVVLGVSLNDVFHTVLLRQYPELDSTSMVLTRAKLRSEINEPRLTALFRQTLRPGNIVVRPVIMTSKLSKYPSTASRQNRQSKLSPRMKPINATSNTFPKPSKRRFPLNATLADDSFPNTTFQAVGAARCVSTITHKGHTSIWNFCQETNLSTGVIFPHYTSTYDGMSPCHHMLRCTSPDHQTPFCTLSDFETAGDDDSNMCDVRDDVEQLFISSTHVLNYYSLILPFLRNQEPGEMNVKDCLTKISILIMWLQFRHKKSVAEKLKSFLFSLFGSPDVVYLKSCNAGFGGDKQRKQHLRANPVKEPASKFLQKRNAGLPSKPESYKNLVSSFCCNKDESLVSCSKNIDDEGGKTMQVSNLSRFWKFWFSRYAVCRRVYTVCPATSTMSYELARLGSLASLPPSWPAFKIPFAAAGFYYDVNNTKRTAENQYELVCYACGVTCSKWDTGETPAEIHRRISPACPHVKTLFPDFLSGNFSSESSGLGSSISSSLDNSHVSFGRTSSSLSLPSSASGSFQVLNAPSSQLNGHTTRNGGGDLETDCAAIAPVSQPLSVSVTQPSDVTQGREGPEGQRRDGYLEDRPTVCMGIAVYPQFSTSQSRLATFQSWPATHFFDPKTLVTLGFFYAGYADCIRCFYCGVGLKSWEPGDDVTEEHIRWRPQCGFIMATRGRRFVENVLARLSTESSGDEVSDSMPARQEPSPALNNRQTPSGVSSTLLASSTISPTGSDAGSPLSVTLQKVREMGFPSSIVDRAVAEIEATGIPDVDLNSLVERIVELQQRNDSDTTSHNDQVPTDLQTDGENQVNKDDMHRIRQLREENARLKARRTCHACKTDMVGMIFLPCGHVVCCSQCGSKTRHCPLCKEIIRATANVFLS